MGFTVKLTKEIVSVYDEQIKYILNILGFLMSFRIMNIMVYVMIKIEDVYEKLWKLVKFILDLPIVTISNHILKKGAELLNKLKEKEDMAKKLDEKIDEKLTAVTHAI